MVEPSSVGWGMIAGASQLYKNREGIRAMWDWVARRYWRKTRIGVTGPAGVGKTVLLDALSERMGVQYAPPGQSEQVERRKRRLDKKRLDFIVLPGQDAGARMDGENALLEKPVDGIIYTVCFGFATIREEAARKKLIASGQSTVDAFREVQRRADLEHLDHTANYVRRMFSKHAKPCWMVVAVTKFDLFADDKAAEEYYSPSGSGAFVDKMGALMRHLGTDRFRWSAMPVFAHPEEFHWNDIKIQPQLFLGARAEYVKRFLTHLERHCAE